MATTSTPSQELVIGTRNSKLALVQAERVSQDLARVNPEFKFPWRTVSVSGDVDKTSPFLKFGGPSDAAKNIWTEEMEAKLKAGELDLLVHCLKDMPTKLPSGCVLGAIVHRQDPSDAFVVKESLRDKYTDLTELPAGSVIGTSSTRRKALLAYKFPHLVVQECRGNLDTRLRKLDDPEGPFTAIIVATAGLVRIDMAHRITKRLSPSDFPYAVGQGALGIEIRDDDPRTLSMIQPIEDGLVRKICLAERSLLRTLQGGCSSPVAVYCTPETLESAASPRLRLEGMIIHPHGTKQVSAASSAHVGGDEDAEGLGAEVARLLEENGGRDLLSEIVKLYQEEPQ
ncbi:porphobilinogen deaminase [Aspergillus steynii IBT 23096]|uniref:hydroxymethylbilane synthase n=1 Tax=Aspergillus steynii IBT 23096 TaxID=1392250 RepID=A0A2I2GA60_9EURO|nr:porphobilinogen deaminase [Aspergillus steynii IBT 23096]PLB49743.1 porphobilinogen deaminase [Aspergillus steynii IBT 23096]